MKNIFTTFVALGILIQISHGQIFRQVDPTVINFNNPWNALLFDESSYTSCFNDQINLASYYDPNEPNTKRMNEVLQVSIFTNTNFGGLSYVDNCPFPSNQYYCQDTKSLQDIFCKTFAEIQTNTVLYIVFLYTTYVSCKNTITLAPPYKNILIIKRSFFPIPQFGMLYFGNPMVTSKTIEFNTDPGLIDNIPATGGNGDFSYQWMTLPYNNSNTTLSISGATYQNFDPGKLTSSTIYQRMDIPGVCGVPTKTNTVSIAVLPDINAGQIGTSQTICYGSSATLNNFQSASGGTGTYNYQWQSSSDGTNFQDIPNQNGLEFTTPGLTQSTYFQRKCTSGVNSAFSNIVAITVRDSLSAGILSPTQTICYGSTPLQIIGSNPTGGDGNFIFSWENSVNGVQWTSIPGATSKDFQPNALTSTTYYHRIVNSGSNCGTKISPPVIITVYKLIDPGIISKSQSICYGGTPSPINGIAATGGDGSFTYSWWNSPNGTIWNQIPSANNLSYQPNVLNNSVYYRRAAISSCGTFMSDTILIEVKPNVNPGTIGNPQTICYNIVPLNLSGTAPIGGFNSYSYQWQSSIDNTNWNDVTGAINQSLTPPALSKTSYFRRKVTDSNCGSFYSNSVLINVYNQVPKPSVSYRSFYCYQDNVFLSAGTGSPYSFYWYDHSGNLLISGANYVIPKISQSQTISVKAKDSNECYSDTLSLFLNVDRVMADFTSNTDSIKAGESVNFLNNSINAISYRWDFSEGDQSTAKNPWHYFNVPGKKTIKLISYSGNQCSDTLTRKNLITVSSPNSIGFISEDSLKVFPNPMNDRLWIQYGNNKHISIQVYSINGALLNHFEDLNEIVLDVSQYPAGIYILNIRIDQKMKVYKVIKM